MPKVFIEDNGDYVTFYTGDIDKEVTLDDVRHIYDIRKDVQVVIKTYLHETKNYIKVYTNDIDTEYPGGSVIRIKSGEAALKELPDKPIDNILELRNILLKYFKNGKHNNS